MVHKILCAVDGTSHSDKAVQFAAELANRLGSKLTIASVNVMIGGARSGAMYIKEDREVQQVLDVAENAATGAGAKNVDTAFLRSREAAAGVVAYAEQEDYDIIVTGTGDKHGLSRLVLGSVAADIAGRAHCTVIVAR
ncbi:UspA domain-containing protein [Hyphomicrobium denitrificans 1NES1]|uniref:UspA domain-containing protein n=1 Tax=Hyphomicrobium denitrificans 1NES1 TaxID=670307 RepID=N0B4E8_9HYPH|nr:universal stress protein [Hyphomicrobium denitrificans]AGK57883.1 UspA domain-containing protein [Hyphomicrobium denitrificans 1NES1]